MPYRITRRASEARQRQIEAMQRGQEAARMARPEREAVPELPLLRLVCCAGGAAQELAAQAVGAGSAQLLT